MRRAALVLSIGFVALWPTAARAQDAWRDPFQQSFSKEAADGLAAYKFGSYNSGSSVKAREDADRCRLQPPISRCATMILTTYINGDPPAPVEEALSFLEGAYPVDMVALHGNRRLPIKDARQALNSLKLVASVSSNLHGFSDPRSLRRGIASDIALWRAGATSATLMSTMESVEKALGPNSLLVAQLYNVGAVAGMSDAYGTSDGEAAWLGKAHQVLGESIASNVAVLKLERHDFVAAEALALEGYTALLARHGDRDSRTVSAAAILADVYRTRGKAVQAGALSKTVAAAREQDPFATPMQKIDALAAFAADVSDAEREAHLKRALALADAQVGKSQWPELAKIEAEEGRAFAGLDLSLGGTPMSELGAKTLNDAANDELQARRSRLLVQLAMLKVLTDPAEGERLAGEAVKASHFNRQAWTLQAIALIGQVGKGVSIRMAEFMLGQGEDRSLPVDHVDRITNAHAYTLFLMMQAPSRAPAYARVASQGALARLLQHVSYNEDAASEFAQFRGVFRLQVSANWLAAQRAAQ